MKYVVNQIGMATAMLLLSQVLVFAQGPGGPKGMRMYNPATEITVSGTIEAVTEGAQGQMMGTHLTVRTAEGVREVMLGPSQFIASKQFSFAKGDSVEVTGSKIAMNGNEYLIAREVVEGGKTLMLRDKAGIPEWAGKGMGRKSHPDKAWVLSPAQWDSTMPVLPAPCVGPRGMVFSYISSGRWASPVLC